MSNAIKWISREAKVLRRKHPGRKWSAYIKEASALYRKGHKAASRVAKKVKRAVKRRRVGKKIGFRGPITRRVGAAGRSVGAAGRSVGSVRKFKSKARPGEHPPPIAWHVVKMHNLGFEKKAKGYVTISSTFPRRIVWQDWEAKAAKEYLKKHCIKSK